MVFNCVYLVCDVCKGVVLAFIGGLLVACMIAVVIGCCGHVLIG